MKRILFVILLLLCLTFTLTGCSNSDSGENKIESLSLTVSIRNDVYETLKQSGTNPFDGMQTTTAEMNGQQYISYSQINKNVSFGEAEAKLKDLTLYHSTSEISPAIKSIEIKKNSGLFYNSYIFKVVTNKQIDTAYKVGITLEMPGKLAQTKGGTVEGNKVTFDISDFTQENDFAVYSESNNVVSIVIIISVLAMMVGAFVFFMKRKQG